MSAEAGFPSPLQGTAGDVMPVAAALALAGQHRSVGRLDVAERLCRQILHAEPHNAEALHLLGLTVHQAGQESAAIDLVTRAVAENPSAARYHANLCAMLRHAGRPREAVAAGLRAVALRRDLAPALCNLALAHCDCEKYAEAESCYRRAIASDPGCAEAYHGLGNALRAQGRTSEALEAYRRMLQVEPNYPDTWTLNSMVLTLLDHDRVDEALRLIRPPVGPESDAQAGAQSQTQRLRGHYERAVVTRNYRQNFGCEPNLEAPTTFNEKVVYKMLHDRRPILTRTADKLQARAYVAERLGAQYLPELYQVCASGSEIDWPSLPRRFVIKATHGCGANIFVSDKSELDPAHVAARLDAWLARNHYYLFLEWAYRDIRPALIVEEMLTEPDGAMALDWKFYTFDGRAEFLAVNLDQSTERKVNFYDRSLTRQPFRRGRPSTPVDPRFPANVELMFSLAEQLGRDFDFVRVDMYNLGGRIVFGEFTHYPDAATTPFDPPEFDTLYGSKWRWPPDYGQTSLR
jgi:tetratricopeptide (TPR) repeat protein